jgi:Domain of unknown function (DUF4383)
MRTATFALFAGIAYLSAGILGMIPEALTPPPPDAPALRVNSLHGYLMGLFPVNVLHSAVHAAIGIWGLVAWQADHIGRRVRSPRMFARAIAIFYGALALLGLFPGLNTLYGVLPIHGHDVWLHGGTGLIAAYFGWRAKTEIERRSTPVADRREQVEQVVHDRRRGHGDRRIPTSEV